MRRKLSIISVIGLILLSAVPVSAQTDEPVIRAIAFPTDSSLTLEDNYGVPRGDKRFHEGVDILGDKMTPLYAAVGGVVQHLNIPEESWGYAIVLRDSDEYTYHYLHVNNDTPGTDDGEGGVTHAYAPGIFEGATVTRGQLVGWMGDSGNAEDITSHLHFEIRLNGEPINPYPSLVAALFPGTYDRTEAMNASPNINIDKNLMSSGDAPCVSGSLIKIASNSAVYYCGADGKRYVFPNDRVYFTWYVDFLDVTTVSDTQLASVPLGGLVTYRPGMKMVKIESLPNVYAVERGGVLRWVKTPQIAASLYGTNWLKNVDDISDAFFGSYRIGDPITTTR